MPTWPMTRPPSMRTNGVETAVHANPSPSARATPVGKRGHTRPSSAARPGSSVEDDICAL